jgi:dephospho-CoA kinase
MIIGLTGQIGGGKTAAAKILAGFGAHVVDADVIGRQVVDNSPVLRRKLARAFGAEILTKSGAVRRKKLAELAFRSEQGRRDLNGLVHPYLLKDLRRRVTAAARRHPVVIIDAALLLYWRMDREVDAIIVVHTSQKRRLDRIAQRGISRADALARQRSQLLYREFRRRADYLLLNNGSVAELEVKLQRLWKKITGNQPV